MSECKRELNWWEHYPLHKLWCNDYFPIVPRFTSRAKDEWNAWDGGVHWLCIHIWTMSHFSFQIDAEVSSSRLGFGVCLPYLRIWIGVAHIHVFSEFFYKYLTRKGISQ